MNFGYIAIEHMLATQTSSTKCLPYGCFLTIVFQYFMLNLVGVGDPIAAGNDEDDEENERQEAMNVDEKKSEEEPEEETYRREMRPKKKARTKQKMHKRSVKDNLQRNKSSLETTRVYENEVIKLNTTKTRTIVRGKPVVQFSVISLKPVIQFSATEKIERPIFYFLQTQK
ncbi:hypothetical protein M9H77_35666 [Catharanthus roseus]|uniref:Uncharacterized protein n=1 Tax=Catharanthus roseus TaxID=4058 RepID=A0ACB9ZS81_CATRO|nr:hypothetical protein M9H77_35666 [Catharanthus roseus]